MKTEHRDWTRANKAVVAMMQAKGDGKKDIFFLFTVSQVEEVLSEITVRAIPFAPDFVEGMCSWRGQIVPVVDIEKRFGFSGREHSSSDRYLVVRTGISDSTSDTQLLHGVFRVSGEVKVIGAGAESSIVSPGKIGIEPSLARGTFQQKGNFLIVPDVALILQNEQKTDIL